MAGEGMREWGWGWRACREEREGMGEGQRNLVGNGVLRLHLAGRGVDRSTLK